MRAHVPRQFCFQLKSRLVLKDVSNAINADSTRRAHQQLRQKAVDAHLPNMPAVLNLTC